MREPSVRASRLAIAGGAAATIVIGAVGFFLGRATYPTPEPITPVVIEAPAPRPSPTPVLPSVWRSEEHTSELQSLMRISYAVFCLKKKKITIQQMLTQRNCVKVPIQRNLMTTDQVLLLNMMF